MKRRDTSVLHAICGRVLPQVRELPNWAETITELTRQYMSRYGFHSTIFSTIYFGGGGGGGGAAAAADADDDDDVAASAAR